MGRSQVVPLCRESRPACSLPMAEADLSLDNANWTKGLQAASDWIWSGHLHPVRRPNNLARFLLHIPGVFEQQLNFSTTLIFDGPSFNNGRQVSGFVDRVSRLLAISLIAQLRRCRYMMTHHAIRGRLTCDKLGLGQRPFAMKWSKLTEHRGRPDLYSRVERAVLEFAEAFATNPKSYDDRQVAELRAALAEDNRRRFAGEGAWRLRLDAARRARAIAMVEGLGQEEADRACREAADAVSPDMPDELNERHVNAQVVELAFLCLQCVALCDVCSGLNIPDEESLAGEMVKRLPEAVIERINELGGQGLEPMPELVPPPVEIPFRDIVEGRVRVDPARLTDRRLARVPLEPYEGADRPAFPSSLLRALRNHPELARYEPPYSLALRFNEDAWRGQVQTAGFVSRRLKELVVQKVSRVLRSRYAIEHHTRNLYNTYLDELGVGRPPRADFDHEQQAAARSMALQRATQAALYMLDHKRAPAGVYSEVERAALTWVERLVCTPHIARRDEPALRRQLERENRRQIASGSRRLDRSPGLGEAAAMKRLVDHQVAELAMLAGHTDGLARAMTILRLVAEDDVREMPGVDESVITLNELLVNPRLSTEVKRRLRALEREIRISGEEAARTGEL